MIASEYLHLVAEEFLVYMHECIWIGALSSITVCSLYVRLNLNMCTYRQKCLLFICMIAPELVLQVSEEFLVYMHDCTWISAPNVRRVSRLYAWLHLNICTQCQKSFSFICMIAPEYLHPMSEEFLVYMHDCTWISAPNVRRVSRLYAWLHLNICTLW